MEWLIEKLTELGVVSIRPLICDHSERKIIKVQRLEKIAIAALKQSQQFYLPKIHPLNSFWMCMPGTRGVFVFDQG